jgi:hypothetical protein
MWATSENEEWRWSAIHSGFNAVSESGLLEGYPSARQPDVSNEFHIHGSRWIRDGARLIHPAALAKYLDSGRRDKRSCYPSLIFVRFNEDFRLIERAVDSILHDDVSRDYYCPNIVSVQCVHELRVHVVTGCRVRGAGADQNQIGLLAFLERTDSTIQVQGTHPPMVAISTTCHAGNAHGSRRETFCNLAARFISWKRP